MLRLSYLGQANKLPMQELTKRYLIVRKPVSGIPKGFMHVPQLSPSLPLFDQAQAWKQKNYTTEEIAHLHAIGVDESNDYSWWHLYEREFKTELLSRPDMVRALQRLGEQLDREEDIVLFCYCKDVRRCHRRLVGEHMQSKGYEVDFGFLEEKEIEPVLHQVSLFD